MVSALFAKLRLWQAIRSRPPSNKGQIFEHITNLDEVRILNLSEFWRFKCYQLMAPKMSFKISNGVLCGSA
jgi:hypothetical protein